ncbi:MAG: hypothetical protein DIU69_00530 [Bacillota bacterium]|nr:MAG: hypothetical protein DIU69_00530 [Bacillota bacterium]
MKGPDCYFPSERDYWLGLLVWAPPLLFLYEAITDGPRPAVAIALGISLLIAWLWFGTGYRITAAELHVKAGPFRWRVPLSSIRRVRPTNSPLSAPALSLRRLEIALEHGQSILVSPTNRESFIALLRDRCPHARFDI